MTPAELHEQVLEVMARAALPPGFKTRFTHADAVDRLWYLAARAHNEECDRRKAETEAAR